MTPDSMSKVDWSRMTRPAPQHADAAPQPHQQPVCSREGCDRRAVIVTASGVRCARHAAEERVTP